MLACKSLHAGNQPACCLYMQEYQQLVSTFKRQEALLYQFSEEKVQLAQHALELVTNHQRDLDAVSSTACTARMACIAWQPQTAHTA